MFFEVAGGDYAFRGFECDSLLVLGGWISLTLLALNVEICGNVNLC